MFGYYRVIFLVALLLFCVWVLTSWFFGKVLGGKVKEKGKELKNKIEEKDDEING